jgi:hypothetical protein
MTITVLERNDSVDLANPDAKPVEGYNVQDENGQHGYLRLSVLFRQQNGEANLKRADLVVVEDTTCGGDWPHLNANAIRKLVQKN